VSDLKIVPLRGKRPAYSEELADRIVELARRGLSMRAVASELNLGYRTVMDWQRDHTDLAGRVRVARQAAVEEGKRPAKGPGVSARSENRVGIILDALSRGCGRGHAAALAGVHPSALDRWMDADPELEQRVIEAEARLQDRMLGIVSKAAPSSWQAAAWTLERRFPELYARRFEMSPSERQRMAKAIGGGLADLLVKSLGDTDLSTDQQEAVRRKLTEALAKVAG
jgi:hypothetical protein